MPEEVDVARRPAPYFLPGRACGGYTGYSEYGWTVEKEKNMPELLQPTRLPLPSKKRF
jgi:hypothetical protein